jgi:hypothetical protein
LFHFAVAQQHRLLGGLAVDPLGAVGDGGLAGFATEMRNRATEEARARIDELDRLTGDGGPDDLVMRQHLALIWPGYFADPARAPAMPDISVNAAAYGILFASIKEELPGLEASLGTVKVPIGFLAGSESPSDHASVCPVCAVHSAHPGLFQPVLCPNCVRFGRARPQLAGKANPERRGHQG